MKYSIILTLLLFGCTKSPQPQFGGVEFKNGDYIIKTIDSCEYIEYDYGVFDHRVYSLTHKGNCKFCEQRKNKTR